MKAKVDNVYLISVKVNAVAGVSGWQKQRMRVFGKKYYVCNNQDVKSNLPYVIRHKDVLLYAERFKDINDALDLLAAGVLIPAIRHRTGLDNNIMEIAIEGWHVKEYWRGNEKIQRVEQK